MALAFFFPVAISAVFLVWTRVTTVQLGYELARLQAALQVLEEQNRVRATEVSRLRAPLRLRTMAVERFGLRPPSAEQVAAIESPRRGGRRRGR